MKKTLKMVTRIIEITRREKMLVSNEARPGIITKQHMTSKTC